DCTSNNAMGSPGHACVSGACGCSNANNSECVGITKGTKCNTGSHLCVECLIQTDCAGAGNGLCTNNACATPTCNDGIKNQGESDIDCGGANCTKCDDGKACGGIGDCKSNLCVASVCRCGDNVKNGSETDTDCGGAI